MITKFVTCQNEECDNDEFTLERVNDAEWVFDCSECGESHLVTRDSALSGQTEDNHE